MSKATPNLLIKSATIVDPSSNWNNKKASIVVEKGKIKKIGKNLTAPKGFTTISIDNLHISPGWMDIQANFCDPGFEYKEDLNTGAKAAAAGGFTGVLSSASTIPALDNRSTIEYVINKTKKNIVDIFPCGAITKGLKGEEMAEMADMNEGGAIAFSDNKNSIQNPNLLIKSLLYSKTFDGLIVHFPSDQNITNGGQMNEGVTSTKLGLKSIPSLAEELVVERDLQLLKYTGHKLHFSMLSSPASIQQVKKAKKENYKVSCGVSSYHLLLNEELLETFDSNYKVLPPLKPKQDITALINGLKDNTIDVIVSDHSPENIENKNCEFDHASFGIINLETSFAVANTALRNHLKIDSIIEKICHNPRKILGLKSPEINEGQTANFTLFDPDLEWSYSQKKSHSKSTNSPFFDQPLIGKAVGIYNKGQLYLTT